MIISRLTGGLGNQMFQYAAGVALAHSHRTALKLDTSWFSINRQAGAECSAYELHCLNVMEHFATDEEIKWLIGPSGGICERIAYKAAIALGMHRLSKLLAPNIGQLHEQRCQRFYSEFFDQPDNTYLSGTFQSERFFDPAKKLLRNHFTFRFPLSPELDPVKREIQAFESVSVHFRRGDYVDVPAYREHLGELPISYYLDALDLIRDKIGTLLRVFVFSDDIDAIERDFAPDCPTTYVTNNKLGGAHEEMHLMALCKHNIIANSSFSWWAAWLNAHKSKIVIAPDPFFRGLGADGADIVPDTWIRMPVTFARTDVGCSRRAAFP